VDGTPFGRYRLIELLGRSGMGEVWRAHDTVTDRVVAVKVLPAHLADDKAFVQRFRREAHAAARLNNPHIIPIHAYGEIDGRLYVDMRLIEGRDLQEVLADGPLEPGRAVRIIEQVAKALHAAHKVGLVHRDVKPSNILLDCRRIRGPGSSPDCSRTV
jgi:serine/threonine protein kinase